MSRIKCSECGKLAHSVVEGKTYCADCVPEPWPDPPSDRELPEEKQPVEYFKPLGKCIEKKKSWWTNIIEFLDDRRPK